MQSDCEWLHRGRAGWPRSDDYGGGGRGPASMSACTAKRPARVDWAAPAAGAVTDAVAVVVVVVAVLLPLLAAARQPLSRCSLIVVDRTLLLQTGQVTKSPLAGAPGACACGGAGAGAGAAAAVAVTAAAVAATATGGSAFGAGGAGWGRCRRSARSSHSDLGCSRSKGQPRTGGTLSLVADASRGAHVPDADKVPRELLEDSVAPQIGRVAWLQQCTGRDTCAVSGPAPWRRLRLRLLLSGQTLRQTGHSLSNSSVRRMHSEQTVPGRGGAAG